jgi:hypothetical protein
MNWKNLLTILGLTSKETIRAFLTVFDKRAGGLEWTDADPTLLYFEVGDIEAGVAQWEYDEQGVYFILDGKRTAGEDLIVSLLNSLKLNMARTYFPAESHPGPWQLASALNGIMVLLGLPYKWVMGADNATVVFALVNGDDQIEIPVDRLIAFVRNILTRGNVEELSNPSRIYGALKAHSIAR